MPENIIPVVIVGVIFLWLLALSIFVWLQQSHYNNLTKDISNKTLTNVLNHLLKQGEVTQKDIDSLKLWCDKIEKDGVSHLQKVGLLRFNPFKDTGGDQSFTLAFVDKKNTGVIISSLYSRSGTRWYAKQVTEGKGTPHELSVEEQKALKQIQKDEE